MFLYWACDLIDFNSIKTKNRGYAYILLCVDAFSKMTFVEPMKSKNAQDVEKAFAAIFKRSKQKPEKLYADKERAFISSTVQEFFDKNGVKLYHPISWLHASLAERYIRTFKSILARVLTFQGNKKWFGLEQDIANQMNNSFNRSIKMKPVEVSKKNESQVWDNLYSKYITAKPGKPKFKVGDLVRISARTLKDIFKKGYDVSWSTEIFKISEVRGLDLVPYYLLTDMNGEKIEGTYTDFDLQQVTSAEPKDGKL